MHGVLSNRLPLIRHYTIQSLFSPVLLISFVKIAQTGILREMEWSLMSVKGISSEEFGKEALISRRSGFSFLSKVDQRLQRPHDLSKMQQMSAKDAQ